MTFIKLAHKFAGIFSSTMLLIIGTYVLLKAMSIDYYSVLKACKLAIPSAIISGGIGFIIGKILDSAPSQKKKSKEKLKDRDLLIDDLLIDDLDKITKEIQ